MPRQRRFFMDGHAYHVLNRGNRRQVIFKKDQDYRAFLALVGEACRTFRMPMIGLCLMNNHWHMVIRPQPARSVSAYMHWLLNVHVHRYNKHYGLTGLGHLYQGRYKAFPIQDDAHMFTVLRYVEANPLRAGLVETAEQWKWSSLTLRRRDEWQDVFDHDKQVELPTDWPAIVNGALPEPELRQLRASARVGMPFGDADWLQEIKKRRN
jgi:REP-associated tyrosine transposase